MRVTRLKGRGQRCFTSTYEIGLVYVRRGDHVTFNLKRFDIQIRKKTRSHGDGKADISNIMVIIDLIEAF